MRAPRKPERHGHSGFLRRPRQHLLVVLSATLATAGAGAADTATPDLATLGGRTLFVPRTTAPVTVDGRLDDSAWSRALSIDLAYEVQPGENVPPPVRTEVLLTHDEDAVYFAFRAYDPDPGAIRAHLYPRDTLGADDWVGIILDTFNDERRCFDFIVNPLGVQYDQIELTGAGEQEWDAIWESAAATTDWGWAAEIRVPFSSLRFQKREGDQVWGFDAVRSYPRSSRHHIGTFPRDRSNNCYLCQALKIRGFGGVVPGNDLEIVPTVTSSDSASRESLTGDGLVGSGTETEGGLTARWGLTPNLTLSGTVNPDFSQVEADALQLDVNQPFALSYAEKRPFFMEGADYFSSQLDVVYTRTVRDPAWGAKLTGKSEGHTVAAFVTRDELTNLIIPGSRSSGATSLRQPSTASAFRYKRDAGSRLTLGALATDREGDGYFNRVGGLDFDFRLTDTERIRGQFLAADTQYPEAVRDEFGQGDRLRDWAGEVVYSHSTRTFDAWVAYRDIGADFRADLGFMPRVDVRHAEAGASYAFLPRGQRWFDEIDVQGQLRRVTQHDGELLFQDADLMVTYTGPLQSHAVVELTRGREGWQGREYGLTELYVHNCFKPGGHTHVYFNLTAGDRIDYAGSRPGDRVRFESGIVQNLGRHLSLELGGTRESMEVDAGRLYTATLGTATLGYQFSTRTQVRAILQYTDVDYNLALYDDPDLDDTASRLFTQFLFSYMVNPQTVLFLGYSDVNRGNQDVSLTRTDRTLFAKVGYAFVL